MKSKCTKLLVMLALILTVVLGMSVTAHAEVISGDTKGTVWSVDTDAGVLTIRKDGEMGEWTRGATPWYNYRSQIKTIKFENGVTRITNYAFADLVMLEAIELPNSMERVDSYAFLNCSAATRITIPVSTGTWGKNVFEGCVSVNYIYTENESDIASDASLWDATVGSAAAGGVTLEIASGALGQYAFYNLNTVTEVILPTTMGSVNDYAFYGFTSPFAISLANATTVGDYAFYGCSGATIIDLPKATTIGDYTFYGCSGVESISAPAATWVGSSAFEGCSAATSIYVGNGNTTYGANNVFKDCTACTDLYLGAVDFSGTNNLQGLGTKSGVTLTIGKGLKAIGSSAMSGTVAGTSGAMTLVLEEGSQLTSIGASAFKDNTSLVEVDLTNAEGDMTLGESAFDGCSKITTFSTGKGKMTLGNKAMANMSSVETFNLWASSTEMSWTANTTVRQTVSKSGTQSGSWIDATMQRNYYNTSGSTNWLRHGQGYIPTKLNFEGVVGEVVYAWESMNIADHPFYGLGKDTENGSDINIEQTVRSIADDMFTSGIELYETSSGYLTVDTSTVLDSFYVNGDVQQYLGVITAGNTTDDGKTSTYYTQVYFDFDYKFTVTPGTKLTASSGIKLNAVYSNSSELYEVGSNAFGSRGLELTTELTTVAPDSESVTKLDIPTTDSTYSYVNTSTPSYSRSLDRRYDYRATSTTSNTYGLLDDTWLLINANTSSSSVYAYANASTITSYESTITTGAVTREINAVTSGYYNYGFNDSDDLKKWLMSINGQTGVAEGTSGASPGLNMDVDNVTATGSVSKTWTTTTTTTTAANVETIDSGLKTVSLGVAAANAVIKANAFAGQKNITDAYLASTINTVESEAFNTTGTGGIMYLYGRSAGDAFASQPGIASNNDLTISWMGSVEDYGQYIDSYQVGAMVTAYLYRISGDGYRVYLSGTGDTYDNYTAEVGPGWAAAYGRDVVDVIIDDGVTSVGAYMFYNHTRLTEVTYGAGVTKLGSYAFANSGLVDVVIPATINSIGAHVFDGSPVRTVTYNAPAAADVTAEDKPFFGLTGETVKLTIADTVTAIPAFMFHDSNFSEVVIGSGVTSIGNGAFASTHNLDTVTIADGNTAYKVSSETGDIYTTDGLTLVAYMGGHTDETYVIPVGVTGIGAGAFYGHDYVNTVHLDATVTSVGADAFAGNIALSRISISDYMDLASFQKEVALGDNWSGSAEVVLSGLAWDIGVNKGEITATLYSDGTLAIVGNGVMKSWPSANSVDWLAKRGEFKKVTFEGNITSIGSYAFYGCENLTEISLPDTISAIGQYAFYGCKNINGMYIPDKVTTIETYAFANCTNMPWLDGGLGLVVVEPFAFANCTNTRYIVLSGNVTTVRTNAFTGDKNLTVLVAGKSQDTDFEHRDGVVASHVFRICYMPEVEDAKVLTRYAANKETSAGRYENAVATELWAYGFDTNQDGKIDYLHIAGAAGMETDWTENDVPWKDIKTDITRVYVEDDVTSIGPYAFSDCTALTHVRIGKLCQTMATKAFYGCSALEKMNIHTVMFNSGSLAQDSQVFYNSGSANGFTVVFEDTVTRIPGYLFYNCVNLSALTFGKALDTVSQYAFSGCTGLKTLYIKSDNIISNSDKVFTNAGSVSGGFTVEIAANVTKIPASLFYSADGNPYVTSVTVANGSKLTEIGSNAFKGCNRLTEAYFANCTVLTDIKSQAFEDCTRLVSADFSNCIALSTIGGSAFRGCQTLSQFSIENDLALYEIEAEAFTDCVSITDISLPSSLMEVGSNAFGNWVGSQIIYVLGKFSVSDFDYAASGWSSNATVIYTSLAWDMSVAGDGSIMAYYTPPDSSANAATDKFCIFVVGTGPMKDFAEQDAINWVGKNATTDVRSTVNRIVINDGITRIGNYNFAGFDSCYEVLLGDDIVEVGDYAFKDDVLVSEIDLSGAAGDLEFIGDGAFENCSGLTTMNLSGCDNLAAVGANAFKNLSGSSVIFVSSDALYDMLANVNGNIKSTYGTTANTKVVSVRVHFTDNLTSQGVMNGTQVTWHVEAVCVDNLAFTWYYATEKGGAWTEITKAMSGYTINSTTSASTLVMDASIVTLDKNGYYFMVVASSPYYSESSDQAALAVYSSAVTPVITVVDKNGDTLESNTWTQGPLTIYITPGTTDNNITPTYQYKLKASGTWRNAEPVMTYNTEGIVTFYCRAIINGDGNTASPSVKYILKVDNSGPTVTIEADPEFESTESVDLTATANDQVSGVQSIGWYKTAADANTGTSNSGVTGYVPLMSDVDMNTVALSVRHFLISGTSYTADETLTTYVGKNETHSAESGVPVDTANESDTVGNATRLQNAVGNGSIEAFELYEVHVLNGDGEDYGISTTQKGIITLPVPSTFDPNRLAVYSFNRTGTLTPISSFTLSEDGSEVTFSVSSFGQFALAMMSAAETVEVDGGEDQPAS